MRLLYLIITGILLKLCYAGDEGNESDGDTSRKILGSSVVTSVSVVMDTGNRKNAIYTDAVGKPQSKPVNPSELASPIDLLNPDRYEFYTFDDNGDLVKRLMSLDEIKSIIATGDSDALDLDSFTSQGFLPEKRVSDVVNNVQNVLKEEMEILKDPITKPIFDTPDVSDSWSMILPAVFGNSGEDIKPEKPVGYVTPETIMLEPNSYITHSTLGPKPSSIATTKRPLVSLSTKKPSGISTSNPSHMSQPVYYSSPTLLTTKTISSTTEPILNVEIISNGISTTDILPSKVSSTQVSPIQEIEMEPTRAQIIQSTRPPLIRNATKVTGSRPSLTQPTSAINSILTHPSTSARPQTTAVFSSSVNPTTQKIISTSQEILTRKPSLKPTTTQWSSTSFRPTSTQLSDASNKPPATHSTTIKPIIMSPVPNIFGLPVFIDASVGPTSTQLSSTSYKPSSANPTNAFKPTRSPTPNIFGLPSFIEHVNNPTTLLATSTSSVPVKSTSLIGTSTSQISIKPQLSTSSTVGNLVYSSSLVTKNPTLEIASPKITTDKYIENVVLYNTNTQLGNTLGKHKSKYNMTSTESYNDLKPATWAPNPEDTQLFNIFKEVLSQSTTENNKNLSSSSLAIAETTNINDALDFEFNKIQTANIGDLSVLSTENLLQKVPTTTDSDIEDITTKLPPLLNSLNDKQKLSASELLDQLLLTTNIYEINTELAASKLNISDMDNRFDNSDTNNSSLSLQDSEQQMTTIEHDIIYPPTTDITLIQSIEQLLSQAVGDVQTILNETTERTQNLLHSSPSDAILTLSKETKTQAAEYITTSSSTEPELIYTTVNNPSDLVNNFTSNDLNGSVEALLSQMNDHTPSVNNIIFTEKPNLGVTYRRVEETDAERPAKITTQKPTVGPKISLDPNETKKFQIEHIEENQEATTFYYVVKKDPKITTTEETTSHLINITLLGFDPIKNRTKPAKADLSLEQELVAEEIKNMTLLLRISTNNTVEQGELLKESETNAVLVNSTSAGSHQIDTKTEGKDIISDSTTSQIPLNADTTIQLQDETTEQYSISTPELETTMNDLRFTEEETTELVTTETNINEIPVQSSTTQYLQASSSVPKPSIVITINENRTVVTENGKLVANKTISAPPPLANISNEGTLDTAITLSPSKQQKNSTHDQTWTLVSTVAPQHTSDQNVPLPTIPYPAIIDTPAPVDLVPKPMQGFGLEDSTSTLDIDVHQFTQLCNELAFGFWKTVTTGLSSARSIFVSPFAATSMLAMVFLGAKGATSEEMNEILKLDDMVTFNPHLIFKSVSESITSDQNSGVATAAMIRELFSDRSKGKLLEFYKNRVRAFYDGFVEEVSYREIGDVIRRRSNLLVKKYTNGKYPQFFNDASIIARSPLSGVSINIFETDCSQTSTEGRDGELHFIVFPSIKQRRLVPVPAVVYKFGFLAGYEASLDATAVALGSKDQVVSTILVIPGQQGISASGDGLARLEKRLVESSFKKGAWSRLLRSLIPRPGLEVQIPRFAHRSVINATNTLQRMGLHELFNPQSADLRGLNGVANELHLSDVLQINKFATCGEKRVDETHHSEVYPATTMRARAARRLHKFAMLDHEEPRDYQRAFHDPLHNPLLLELPLSLRPRQARIPDIPRLRFDRPFLYFVRHNPTGLILHMGRFNPRLLP